MYRVFIKCCVFPENSRKFATSPSPALGCYWLYKILPANGSDCTLALKVSYSDEGEGGVAGNCEKTPFFLNTLYNIMFWGGYIIGGVRCDGFDNYIPVHIHMLNVKCM